MATRRQWIAFAGLTLAAKWSLIREALALGQVEKGVYRVRGDARINGVPAKQGMEVKAGDVVTTGPGSEIVFVTARDAFLVRANSRVEAQGVAGELVLGGLRIVTGAVLSVFSPGERKRVQAPTATIGIRGTAVYVEAEAAKTYICTCYGVAEIQSVADPALREVIETTHHDEPRYVMAMGAPQMMMKGPVINHTDAELVFLESLAGRRPPFLDMPGYEPGRY
jgi:hypothetical protein